MPSLFGWIASHLPGKAAEDAKKTDPHLEEFKKIGLTADMLKAGVEALRAYEYQETDSTKSSVIDRTVPPPEALPLLAAISQSNYVTDIGYLRELLSPYDFSVREIRREHKHGWLSVRRHRDENDAKHSLAPYARVWFLQPTEIKYSAASAQRLPPGWTDMGEWTGGLMIVSFTGSTTGQDWMDDARAFTHTPASFIHPDLDTINAHHGFADWLNRQLDTSAKLETTGASDQHGSDTKPESTTVYNAVLSAIADLRKETKEKCSNTAGGGKIKMIVVGHSLGGAVASLFSLRLSAMTGFNTMLTDSHWYLFGDPYAVEDKTGKTVHPDILPVKLALTVTFGAPRFLWKGLDASQAQLEAQRAQQRREREKQIKAEWEEDERTGHQIQRGFRPDNVKWPIYLDNVPIARIVNARDPVPHVPAGAGELPSGLNVLSITQDKENDTAVLESHGPQAGEGAATNGISIPQDIDANTYVHLGHQWVLDGGKMVKLPSGSDTYISDMWGGFKDLVTHSPWSNSIASQHYMGTYLANVVKQYPKSA